MVASMSRTITITLLLVLAASSMLCFETANAQSVPTPSVPTFSLAFIDHSYDMPGRTVDDGYIGPHYVPAHHDRNGTVEITVANQPFTPYVDANNHTVDLFFHFRCKGHLDSTWIVTPDDGFSVTYLETSSTQYTVFSYWINEEWVGDHSGRVPNIPQDGKIDFQVEAFIGYSDTICTSIARRADDYHTYFVGQVSGWSNTRTISLNDGSTSSSTDQTPSPTTEPTMPDIPPNDWSTAYQPQPTATPNQPSTYFTLTLPQFDWLEVAAFAAVGAVFAVLVVVIVLMRRRISVLENKIDDAK
jgi:hypothetical protein